MDWMDCAIVERVPGKLSGVPTVRHSRVRPEDIVDKAEEGEVWLADAFGLPIEDMRIVIAFDEAHQAELAPSA